MNGTVKLGLILGSLSVVSSLLMKFINPAFLFSWKSSLIYIIIGFIVAVILGKRFLRNEYETLTYGSAVKKLFLAFFIAFLVGNLANILLFSNDQNMISAFNEYIVKSEETGVRVAGKLIGQSEAEMEAALEELREKRERGEHSVGTVYPYSWSGFPFSLVSATISALILSLILAFFIKEKDTGLTT